MAERIEEPESATQEALDQASPAAVALALGRTGRGKPDIDAKAGAFLDEQTELIRLQKEHLHEQRILVLSRLRWGRFRDRMMALLQVMTAAVGLLVAVGVVWMAWSASQERGLVIEPFSVPPDLAQKGLTGQVVASMLLDKLGEMQSATTSSRSPSTYANNWNDEIKVEIPETGVSVGELRRLLVQWLGRQTSISGELYRTPTGLALAARTGTASATAHAGSEADIDAMVQAAAEDVYRTSQPYRYAVWLGRSLDPASVAKSEQLMRRLAIGNDPTDRIWARNGLASSLQNPDPPASIAAATDAIRLDPHFSLAYVNRSGAEGQLGHDEASLADTRAALAVSGAYGRSFYTAESQRYLHLQDEANLASDLGDWRTAAREQAAALQLRPDSDDTRANEASNEAFGHNIPAARTTAGDLAPPDAADQSTPARLSRLRRQFLDATEAYALDDWPRLDATVAQVDPSVFPGLDRVLLVQLKPFRALAMAKQGDIAGARALIATTPLDCYLCARMRGRIEAQARNWPAAERWFAEAVRQGPSIPFAYADWAGMKLAMGDSDGALAKLKLAVATGPHFADAYELEGEALMTKRDYAGAATAFAKADANAPNWGGDHLRWGEALMLAGRYAEARRQFETANGLEMSLPDRAALKVLLERTASGPLHG
jgi:tetratricopeptide (TPR) repeat protein